MHSPRVLFILKQRQHGAYGTWNYSAEGCNLPSGLSVSAGQIVHALNDLDIDSRIVQVVDNNCIDREVTRFKPTHVVIEAFWVVPEKFEILKKLHPKVKWIIRNHSKCDFLSHEGGMVGWAIDYIRAGVTLACNSHEATSDFKSLAKIAGLDPSLVIYLPNYYAAPRHSTSCFGMRINRLCRGLGITGNVHNSTYLNIGCFGAIRPLKNNLQQAIAAMEAADLLGKKLKFYINSSRVEGKADSILNSLRQLFKRFDQHTLVEVPWLNHNEFTVLASTMDMVVQVSNSETFNIVAADAVAQGVMVLVSDEIPWLDKEFQANPNSVASMTERIVYLHKHNTKALRDVELKQLREYAEEAKWEWEKFLHKQ